MGLDLAPAAIRRGEVHESRHFPCLAIWTRGRGGSREITPGQSSVALVGRSLICPAGLLLHPVDALRAVADPKVGASSWLRRQARVEGPQNVVPITFG